MCECVERLNIFNQTNEEERKKEKKQLRGYFYLPQFPWNSDGASRAHTFLAQ